METAKLFKNGRSQAVCLHRKYSFSGDEVFVKKVALSDKGENGLRKGTSGRLAYKRLRPVRAVDRGRAYTPSARRVSCLLLLGVVGAVLAGGCLTGGLPNETSTPAARMEAVRDVPRPPGRRADAADNLDGASYELPRSPFGLHVISRDLSGPVELGAHWTRYLVLWKLIQPRKDEFLDLDRVVPRLNELAAAGIEVLPRFVSVALWANSPKINRLNAEAADKHVPMGNWTYIGMPTDVAAYTRFLTDIVERFDGDHFADAPGLETGIKYWQVENEWDWRWKDSPEMFVSFLEIAYRAIKAADPDAIVVLGGISKVTPDAFHAGLLGDSVVINGKRVTPAALERQPSFVEEHQLRTYVLEHGQQYFDVLSFHQYGRYQAIGKEVEYLRGIMHQHGYDKPLWMTEAGGPFTGSGETYSEDRQAQEVVKYYVTALANGVEVVFWSTYEPTPEWGAAFSNTSLVDARGRKKPAYYSYKLLATKLEGAVRVDRLLSSESEMLIRFARRTGRPVFVAWRDGGLGRQPVPERLRSLVGNSLHGKSFEVTAYDGKVRVVNDLRAQIGPLLAAGPIFIEPR